MPRTTYFNSPLLLGFDQVERMLDRLGKSAQDGYPPYNIEQAGTHELLITLAVAGFSMDDLEVSVEENQLIIKGEQADEEERTFLHRGIAARQFQRTFILADGIEVMGAELENGLLTIRLNRPETEGAVKRIEIKSGGDTAKRFPTPRAAE